MKKKIFQRENQIDAFKAKIKPIFGRSIKDDQIAKIINLKEKEFEEAISEKFGDFRKKRIKEITESTNVKLEKRIFLQTVDFLWRSHIQYLEHLRQVVGLRGYAQKDPLEEFKREAFKLFEGLLNKIKIDFVTFLNNLEVVKETLEKEKTSENKSIKTENKKTIVPRKMKRNEPCFCGSGKKYKHCCGSL